MTADCQLYLPFIPSFSAIIKFMDSIAAIEAAMLSLLQDHFFPDKSLTNYEVCKYAGPWAGGMPG